MTLPSNDDMLWRKDILARVNGGITSNTLRVWLKTGKFPKPDVNLSQRVQGWRSSTLSKAGITLV